jgi:predicted aspartyl protease
MTIKKLFIFIAFTITGSFANSQQLTLNETVSYINRSMSSDRKLSLSSEGMLEYTGISYLGKAFTYTVHISEIQPPSNIEQPMIRNADGSNPWRVPINCKGSRVDPSDGSHWSVSCILEKSEDKKSNISGFSLYTKDEDKYTTQKLFNSVNYLITLAEENGMVERKDDDPFAPKNYNPNSVEIKSTSKNGSIKLSIQNGVYHLSVTIGGVTKSFVLDTGASEVLISEDFESMLLKNGTIKKTNYLNPALYRIADGSIVQCRRLVIPKLTIGSFTITNVQASIGAGSVPLLLGKTVLDKFSSWTINNQTQTLNLEK